MISTTALRYFAEVTRCGSFRAAAEHLFIAPSAISRQIALLEEEIGAQLLERGRGRTALRLTAAGEILMRHTKNVDNELLRVRSDIESLKGLRKGEIRFGVPETFSRDYIPDFLTRFSTLYPGVTYHVHVAGTPRLLEMVAADELDASLSFNPSPVADVRHIFERALPTCVIVPRSHPLANRTSLRLSDCADYGLALPDVSISAKRIYDDMFAKAKIRPRPVLVSNSYELLRSASAAGLSISLVNEPLNYRPSDADSFRYIPLNDPRVKPQHFTLCVREGRNLPIAALTFIDQLQQEFALQEQLATP
jgi:DNA-binding transcriptional LysR family regulator